MRVLTLAMEVVLHSCPNPSHSKEEFDCVLSQCIVVDGDASNDLIVSASSASARCDVDRGYAICFRWCHRPSGWIKQWVLCFVATKINKVVTM